MHAYKFLLSVPVMAALAGSAPAQAMQTVVATLNSFAPAGQTVVRTIQPGPNPLQIATLNTARFDLSRTGGTFTAPLLGGNTLSSFLAFCIEPQQTINFGQSIAYNIVPLSQAANNIGGIGNSKANLVRELFGRFAPAGGHSAMTSTDAAAFQIAIWEIVRELPSNPLSLASGNIAFDLSSNAAATSLAQGWLSQLDGSGPFAWNLVALQNGALGNAGDGTQDLVAFGAVPEPDSWAMLIAGFGLVGATMRRRKRQATITA